MRHRLFLVAFAGYAAVVATWLLLGLAATLAGHSPDLSAAAGHLAGSADWPGPVRALARGVTAPTQTADAQRTNAALDYLFSGLSLGLGVLLVHLRGRHAVVRLLAVGLVGTAAAFNLSAHRALGVLTAATGHDLELLHVLAFHVVAGVCYVYALLLFPEGRLPARAGRVQGRVRWPWRTAQALLGNLALLYAALLSSIMHATTFVVFYGVLAPMVGIVVQRRRLQMARSDDERQQSRLLLGTLVLAVTTSVALAALTLLLIVARFPGFAPSSPEAVVFGVFRALSLAVPLAVVVAVTRCRLWDIDQLFSRTLRYGVLAVLITAGYVLVVLGASVLLGRRAQPGPTVPLLATCLVAAAVQPLRERVRRAADRLVYGAQPTPEQLLSELTRRVAAQPQEVDLLSSVAQEVGLALRAARCRVVVHTVLGEQAGCFPAGAAGPASGWDVTAPVVHLGQTIGAIALRWPAGERCDARQRQVLADLGRQAGAALATLQLNAELRSQHARVTALAGQLQDACRQAVASGAQERRRLERDIHDGAQQELLALRLVLGAVDVWDEPQVRALEHRLASAREALLDLVRGACPRILSRHGLARAVQAAAEASPAAPTVCVAGLEQVRLPRDVELAAYLCVLEALHNCARHAPHATVRVELRLEGPDLLLRVSDTGPGFIAGAGPGTGLTGLAERLAAAGGQLDVESGAGAGTTVTARLPAGGSSPPSMLQPPVALASERGKRSGMV